MKTKILFSVITVFIVFNFPLSAEFFNQRNIIPGERAALMGGAYTALSEDLTGTYYNPAGIAFIENFAVSTNANLYSYRKMTRKDESGSTWEADNVDLSPTFFGFNISLKPVSLAFSIYQTENYNFSSIYSDGNKVDKFEGDTKSYLMGPTIAFRITDSFSIGASAFYRNYSGKTSLYFGTTGFGMMQSEITYGGFTLGLGAKYNITDSLKIGASYFSESIYLHGTNTWVVDTISTQATGTEKGDMRSPNKFSLGLAYDVKRNYTISVDGIYYMGLNYSQPHGLMDISEPNSKYREDAHYDLSIGNEYFLDESFSLRLGFFTNSSGAPKEKKSEKIDLYGGTFGLGFYTGEVSSGVGFSAMYGNEDYQKGTTQNTGAKYKRFYVSLVVGGSMAF